MKIKSIREKRIILIKNY